MKQKEGIGTTVLAIVAIVLIVALIMYTTSRQAPSAEVTGRPIEVPTLPPQQVYTPPTLTPADTTPSTMQPVGTPLPMVEAEAIMPADTSLPAITVFQGYTSTNRILARATDNVGLDRLEFRYAPTAAGGWSLASVTYGEVTGGVKACGGTSICQTTLQKAKSSNLPAGYYQLIAYDLSGNTRASMYLRFRMSGSGYAVSTCDELAKC